MARRLLVGCEGKEGFDTFDQAERTARLISMRRKARINAYRCRSCRRFHVGSTIVPRGER